MEVAESAEPATVGPPTGADSTMPNGEQNLPFGMDDDHSSSLSEIDDVSDNEPPSDYEPAKPEKPPLENDSEAETERLEESPNNVRLKRDIVVSAGGYEPSPSKLAQSTTYDDVDEEEEPVADDSPSKPRSKNSGIPDTAEDSLTADDPTGSDSTARKRKRLGSVDDTGTDLGEDEPLKKRRGSVKSELSDPPPEGSPLSPEPAEEMPKPNQDTPPAEEAPEPDLPTVPEKAKKGKKGKRRTRRTRDADEEVEGAGETEGADGHAPEDEEAAEREEPDDAETAAKQEEECKSDRISMSPISDRDRIATKKMSAMESLSELEKEFATLRDK